jgi:hypothetical protein
MHKSVNPLQSGSPPPLRRGTAAVFTSFIALFLAACGAADYEATTTPPEPTPISKHEFLREADRICLNGDSQIEAIGDDLYTDAPPGERPSPGEVRRFALNVVVPRIQSEIDAIRALGAPKGDEREVEAILEATRDGIREVRADPEGLVDGPPAGFKRAGDLSQRYGSRECGVE